MSKRYRARHAEAKLEQLSEFFKVVLITGARQVGKSTLLAHVFPDLKSIVFDPVVDPHGARSDPDLFLDSFPAPLVLDEIQFAPELLPAIKRRVDQSDASGQYFLSGSQNLAVLRSTAESLAGRVGILHLEGMTAMETVGLGKQAGWLEGYLTDPLSLLDRFDGPLTDLAPLTRHLWRGNLPGTLDLPDELIPDYMTSYIQTYVERDIRSMGEIQELASFGRFLGLVGALTGQEINASQYGREVGVRPDTARRWLDLLTNTYQWLELMPYQGNAVKRVSGKRKGFLRDTGAACSLQRISSPEALAVSPLLGSLFETWVVNEIHKQFVNIAVAPQAWHWRAYGGAEVDLVLERDGKLYPVEVKCTTNLSSYDTRGLRAFRETYTSVPVMCGLLIYAGRECRKVDPDTIALPWNAVVRPS